MCAFTFEDFPEEIEAITKELVGLSEERYDQDFSESLIETKIGNSKDPDIAFSVTITVRDGELREIMGSDDDLEFPILFKTIGFFDPNKVLIDHVFSR